MTTNADDTHSPTPATEPLALRLSEGLGPTHNCSHCGFPLPRSGGGLRHYGTHTAHQESECLRLLHAEIAELDALRDKLAGILSRTAVALRGPEPPLTRWSWHDLPERAAAAIAAIDLMQRTAQHLAAGRAHDSDCAMHNAPAYPAGECDCGALGPNGPVKRAP